MKKRFLALLCALVLLMGAVPAAAALEGEAARAADTLVTLGLLDNRTDLNGAATRSQAALLLVRLAGAEQAANAIQGGSYFNDAPVWKYPAATYAARQGWFTGVYGLEFHPDESITANAWFTALLRMLGYSDKDGDFTVSGAAVFARHIGLTPISYTGELTRGQLFQAAVDALTFAYRDSGTTILQKLVDTGVCSQSAANALGLLSPELTARQAADRLSAAVFGLATYESQEEIDKGDPSGVGSGFFISADGLAVTNYHCIIGSLAAEILLSTGECYPVDTVVWYDKGMDLAVLRISKTSTDHKTTSAFAYLELAGTQDIRAGDRVYTISNPLGYGLAVSEGVISATSRKVERYTQPCVMSTADISQGSSGGVLLNVYGHVIAVTSGAYVDGNAMFLSVPVDPILTADLSGHGKTMAEVAALENQ